MSLGEKMLFPYAAVIDRDDRSFSIRYALYPDVVAYGLAGEDDPQRLAEDLFCVILDLAERGEVDLMAAEPHRPGVGANFPIRVTQRLVQHLASYGYRLQEQQRQATGRFRPKVVTGLKLIREPQRLRLVLMSRAASGGIQGERKRPLPRRRSETRILGRFPAEAEA